MIVGCLVVEVYIPGAASLKDKRSVVKSVIRRAQNRFNASIVELYNEDLWRRATIGAVIAGDQVEQVERQIQFLLNFLEGDPRWEITKVETEWC